MIEPMLFERELPSGFRYERDFLDRADEAALLEQIETIEFSTFAMRGVVARRRVAFFGRSYDAGGAAVRPIPPFLLRLRDRAASWAEIDASAFVMALVNEYQPGAPIGWHRDAPQYDVVAGISLLSRCRMKFRPYIRAGARRESMVARRTTHEAVLEPRSVYLLAGAARSAYEHHIPAVSTLRYSITFRTARGRRKG
jgi:alkylated DNA repair dioxygenase AlkB